jgi:hypothetical protein
MNTALDARYKINILALRATKEKRVAVYSDYKSFPQKTGKK